MLDSMLRCYDSRSEVRMYLGHRLGVLIGGIGILALIFIVVAAAQRSPAFGKTAATATATATSTPRPTPTPMPTPTATPRPPATPRPTHVWALSGRARLTSDKRTNLRVLVTQATLSSAATPHASTVTLRIESRIENTGKRPASYSARSFYVVSSNAVTSRASTASHGSPPTGTVEPGKSVTLDLTFSVHVPGRYQLIWSDNNHLVPAARVGRYTISKAVSSR